MPTAAAQRRLERDLLEFKRAEKAGDIPRAQAEKIVRVLTVQAMDPTERANYEETKARHEKEDQVSLIRLQSVRDGGDKLGRMVLRQKDANPYIKEFRELSLAGDWDRIFKLIHLSKWGFKGNPLVAGVAFPLGKFRFHWGPDGNPIYVPFTEQDLINYVQPGRVVSQPALYKCTPEQFEAIAANLWTRQQAAAAQYPVTDWRHVLPIYPRTPLCVQSKESLWMKIRTPVVAAVAIVAAVYLGPIIYAKISGALTGAGTGAAGTGGTAASAATQATTFQRIQAGTKTLISYVNKARTIKAVVNGELPPPPIGIPGANFTDWAMIVAKDQIKKQAIDFAMEKGVEYVERKMTEKEEAKLRAEIEQMQRELAALIPPEVKKMPVDPNPELPPTIKKIQQIEVKRAFDFQQLIIPGALVAGFLIFGG